jgi:hypothetical protein
MTPEPSSSDNAAPPLGEVGRITGVFIDPKKAFADIAARPSWILPVVLVIVVSLAAVYTYSTRIGWERAIRQNIETSSRTQNMTAEQREAAIQMQIKFAPLAYIFVVIGPPLIALIVGGVVLLMCKMGGAALTFKQTFAISAWAALPAVIQGILTIVVLFLKNPEEYNPLNPLAFNLGAFMEPPPATGKFIYSLATSIDLFTIWKILLIAVGISVAARKLTFSKAVMLVVAPWIVWVLLSSGFAGMFS